MAQQTLNTPRETTHQRIADALEDIVDKMVDTSSAGNIDYDNTQSGLSANKVQGAVDELASEKVDKVAGKGLSTEDYTAEEKTKLAGIEAGAQVNTVTSVAGKTGAVSLVKGDVGLGNVDNTADLNKPISRYTQAALDEKTDVNNFNALTQEIELFNTYDLSNDVEISVFANDTYKRDKYDRSYETHIPNLDGEYSVSLGDKTFTETCTFTIANEGKSITEVFHTNRKYILGAKLLKAENDEVGDAHVIADVVTLIISKDAPYTTTFDTTFKKPPATGVLTLKVSVKPDEKYVNKENTGGPAEYAYWGSYNGSDLLINNPILTYSETTFGQPKVSGNPITINDAAPANAVDVSVNIEPIQDLHGYDHPWVGGAGKNKLQNNASTTTINDVTLTVNSDGTVTANGTATDMLVFTVGTVTFTKDTSVIYSGVSGGAGWSYSINVKTGSEYQDDVYDGDSLSMTVTANTIVTYVIVIRGGATLNNVIFKPMIRLSTETDSSFAPYTNICPISGRTEEVITQKDNPTNPTVTKTYTIQLGDTIYGGELDVLTGKLRVTHGYIESYNGEPLPSTWISDRDEYSEGATPTIGAQVVYELATPYIIQLTPQQIRLLKGTNNISCNTGDLSIKYYPDNVLGQLKGDIEKGLNAYYDYQIKALWDKINELQA